MRQQRVKKITTAMIKKAEKGCSNCAHFEELEGGIGWCNQRLKDGEGARGARSVNGHCKKQGIYFERVKKKQTKKGSDNE